MVASLQQLEAWLHATEHEHLEFKEAKSNFHFEKLVKYCAALANEGGGSIVLGVTNNLPRKVVGTETFDNLERTKAGLIDKLRLRVHAEELAHPDGRVLVFTAPARPIGAPVPVDGAYWMRAGEDLVPMTPDRLRQIFDETGPDFSAEICPQASLNDLNSATIKEFQRRWHRKSGNASLLQASSEQLLRDAELVTDRGVTYAALILLGSQAALGRHLPQAELVFEYRSSENAGPASQREEFREGFLAYSDRLWALVNLRNDHQHYQDGLFMLDIPTFNEDAVREALLNAAAHRDYRHAGSVFVRQFARRLEIVSPGGFPRGVTPENILDRQQPRNRRIAEAFARCGLVERAGQGANRMFESCIREAKPLPDFSQTDADQVSLTLHGQVQNPQFVRFLERIGQETSANFDTHDFLLLDLIQREAPVPSTMQDRVRRLTEVGVVERLGHGRGARYFLGRRFYASVGQRGTYTRKRGLDRETNKALLLRHLSDHGTASGISLAELQQVLPSLSRYQINQLLDELREAGRVRVEGRRRWAKWFAI